MHDTIKRLVAFDFDRTLINTPDEKIGKEIWSERTGKPYPYKAWWSKPESLDLNVFDIKPFPGIYKQYLKEKATPDTLLIVLTARLEQLRPQVEKVLIKNNIHVDGVDMKYNNISKGRQILNYVRMYPDLEEINVYEDRDLELESYESIKDRIPEDITFNIYRVHEGDLALDESRDKMIGIIQEEIQGFIKK